MIELRGLVVGWDGVLTSAVADGMRAWAEQEDLDPTAVRGVLHNLVHRADGEVIEGNPVHALERGEVQAPYLEARLAAGLLTRGGDRVPADGLLERMLAHLVPAPDMAGLVMRARRAGVKTALLANSWANDYPREAWEEMFDAVVVSGEVGMRKPDPEIFRYTAFLLGLLPDDCVLLDDLAGNVEAARALGMIGVRHESYATSARTISELFGIPLADPPAEVDLRDPARSPADHAAKSSTSPVTV